MMRGEEGSGGGKFVAFSETLGLTAEVDAVG